MGSCLRLELDLIKVILLETNPKGFFFEMSHFPVMGTDVERVCQHGKPFGFPVGPSPTKAPVPRMGIIIHNDSEKSTYFLHPFWDGGSFGVFGVIRRSSH
jgi:hypothetical protein